MKKPRKKYVLSVTRHEVSEYSDYHRYIGDYETVAVSIRQAWNNIRFSNELKNHDSGDTYIYYSYTVTNITDIDPDVPIYQTEDDFLAERDEDISLFEEEPEEEKLPLYATIDGVDYILTDNGEYTEIFD